jgi:two-component system response regulator FixJ
MTPQIDVIIIDDHDRVRSSLRALLESDGLRVQDYSSAKTFLANGVPEPGACLIVDIRMPGMSGLELQEELARRKVRLPLIVVTGHADVGLAVRAMKAGALDFLEKPFDDEALLGTIRRALSEGRRTHTDAVEAKGATAMLALLTHREHEVLNRLTMGESNKLIAHNLGISPRTVEIHRAKVQEKLKARNVSDLVRTVRTAAQLV